MNFNVYIDKKTGERIARLAKMKRKSRNALIREALNQLLEQQSQPQWPREVMNFEGLPKTRPFENSRRELKVPATDPLA
jgi:hypothetical protein